MIRVARLGDSWFDPYTLVGVMLINAQNVGCS
jgi:hypothetical protein